MAFISRTLDSNNVSHKSSSENKHVQNLKKSSTWNFLYHASPHTSH